MLGWLCAFACDSDSCFTGKQRAKELGVVNLLALRGGAWLIADCVATSNALTTSALLSRTSSVDH